MRMARPWALAALVSAGAATPAGAAVPSVAPERRLAVESAAEVARSRLFELARLVRPACGDRVDWSLGIEPFRVAVETPGAESLRLVREQAMREFGAQPGERVFLARQFKTPFAEAGVQRGDRLADAADPAAATAGQTFLQRRDARNLAWAAHPEQGYTLRRGNAEQPLHVTAVPVCRLYLEAIDSAYGYADSSPESVAITLPLIAKLSDAELTMALAHEVAEILVGNAAIDRERKGAKQAAELVSPGLRQLAEIHDNRELGRAAPPEAALIEADRMALWILRAYGIGPPAYLAFLRHLASEQLPVGKPTYAHTRPLRPNRVKALEEAASLAAAGAAPKAPDSVPMPKLAEIQAEAAMLMRANALTVPVSVSAPVPVAGAPAVAPRQHLRKVPPASAYAAGDDAAAVPIGEAGKARYRHYLGLPGPKAFAITVDGRWRFVAGDPDAMAKVLDLCNRDGQPCWLYAVDDTVVWSSDVAKRIGRSAQLSEAVE